MEKHAVARLIGAPPGYVGYDEGGQLVEKVRKQPYAVLLLDEIEKAHPDLFDILLQVMDHATLTDNQGREADFRHVTLIMTSNVGARDMQANAIGFGDARRGDGKKDAERLFSPEFRNRLDEIVTFRALEPSVMERVVEKFVAEVETQLRDKKVTLELAPAARAWLAAEGLRQGLRRAADGARDPARAEGSHRRGGALRRAREGRPRDGRSRRRRQAALRVRRRRERSAADIGAPSARYLLDLQDRICAALEAEDGVARFREERFESPTGGLARPRVLEGGAVIEKSAVHFSHTIGKALPAAATERRPELAGRALRGGVGLADRAPAQSVRADVARERALLRRARRRSRSGGSAAASTSRRTTASRRTPSHWHRAARDACAPLGSRRLPALQEVVRRVLPPAAPQRAARHRRALLRRPRRGRLRALLRVPAQRRRSLPRRRTCRSCSAARRRRTAIASASSSSTAAVATPSST